MGPNRKDSLIVRFFNVGGGDAILLEKGGRRVLIDAGSREAAGGAPAAVCRDHLRRLGVRHLDVFVLTHLHIDHVGGLLDVLEDGVTVGRAVSAWMPLAAGRTLPRFHGSPKNLPEGITAWSLAVAALRAQGCRCDELFDTWRGLGWLPGASMDVILPDVEGARLQRRVFNALLDGGEMPPEKDVLRAGKLRNPASLRQRVRYAGVSIELSGDCYGECWEREAEPCDLFKLPHHGDEKSVTRALVKALRPKHAVFSCGRQYMPNKDRPSARAAKWLREAGASVWYTDAFDDGVQPPIAWPEAAFAVTGEGGLIAPAPGEARQP